MPAGGLCSETTCCRYGHGIRPFLDLGLFSGPMSLPVTSARGERPLLERRGTSERVPLVSRTTGRTCLNCTFVICFLFQWRNRREARFSIFQRFLHGNEKRECEKVCPRPPPPGCRWGLSLVRRAGKSRQCSQFGLCKSKEEKKQDIWLWRFDVNADQGGRDSKS